MKLACRNCVTWHVDTTREVTQHMPTTSVYGQFDRADISSEEQKSRNRRSNENLQVMQEENQNTSKSEL